MRVRREIGRDGGATARQAAIRTSSTGGPGRGLAVGPRPDQATRPTSALRCETDSEASALVDDDLHYNGNLAATFFYTTTLGHLGSIDRYKEGRRPGLFLPPFLPALFGPRPQPTLSTLVFSPGATSLTFNRARYSPERETNGSFGNGWIKGEVYFHFRPFKGRKESQRATQISADPPLHFVAALFDLLLF